MYDIDRAMLDFSLVTGMRQHSYTAPTFGEVAERYIASRSRASATSRQRYRRTLASRLSALVPLPLEAVTRRRHPDQLRRAQMYPMRGLVKSADKTRAQHPTEHHEAMVTAYIGKPRAIRSKRLGTAERVRDRAQGDYSGLSPQIDFQLQGCHRS